MSELSSDCKMYNTREIIRTLCTLYSWEGELLFLVAKGNAHVYTELAKHITAFANIEYTVPVSVSVSPSTYNLGFDPVTAAVWFFLFPLLPQSVCNSDPVLISDSECDTISVSDQEVAVVTVSDPTEVIIPVILLSLSVIQFQFLVLFWALTQRVPQFLSLLQIVL